MSTLFGMEDEPMSQKYNDNETEEISSAKLRGLLDYSTDEVPKLLFYAALPVAKQTETDIKKYNLPEELKEYVLNLKEKLGHALLSLVQKQKLSESKKREIPLLINNGANVNIADKDGQTALFYACRQGKSELALLLIKAGADINIKDKRGYTPFSYTFWPTIERELVKICIEAGADVDVLDTSRDPRTALIWASLMEDKQIAKLLITAKANLNIQDRNGDTALICAAEHGHPAIIKILIEAKANLDIQNQEGKTALISGVSNQAYPEITEMLIKAGADVNVLDNMGQTALIEACRQTFETRTAQGNEQIINLLICAGTNLNLPDNNGYTALKWANSEIKIKVVQMLIEAGANT